MTSDPIKVVGLELEEIEDIIKSNVTITDPNLYAAVYAVAVDIEHAVLEKNELVYGAGDCAAAIRARAE
jgi:hypothetical protein